MASCGRGPSRRGYERGDFSIARASHSGAWGTSASPVGGAASYARGVHAMNARVGVAMIRLVSCVLGIIVFSSNRPLSG